MCDRYVPSSLVLQRMDGIGWDVIRRLNDGADQPELAVILNGGAGRSSRPGSTRAAATAASSGQPGSSHTESRLYHDTAERLAREGWPVCVVDVTTRTAREAADHSEQTDSSPARHPAPGAAMKSSGISLLTFNVGNPSPERAQRQLTWLASRKEHVLVLTETKASARLPSSSPTHSSAPGTRSVSTQSGPGEYGTMIVARVAASPDPFSEGDRLPRWARAAAVVIPAPDGPLRVIGLYVPSRDASPEKTERKRRWLACCDTALARQQSDRRRSCWGTSTSSSPATNPDIRSSRHSSTTLPGTRGTHDLADAFRYLHPREAEYSWVGRTGDGYRYDHAFCSHTLSSQVTACQYVHEPRVDKLSDHSALVLRIEVVPPPVLPVCNPVPADEPATLF